MAGGGNYSVAHYRWDFPVGIRLSFRRQSFRANHVLQMPLAADQRPRRPLSGGVVVPNHGDGLIAY